MATGTGKTHVATSILKKFKTALFIAHRDELVNQAHAAIVRAIGDPNKVGIVKGNINQSNRPYVVSSPLTLVNRFHVFKKDQFSAVFVDEAHRYMAEQFYNAVTYFTPKLRIGLSATPYRLDGLQLIPDLFDKISYEYDIIDGIRDGFLCNLKGIKVKTNLSLKGVKTSGGDFNTTSLSNRVNCPERNQLIATTFKTKAKSRQGVFFCCDKQHVEDLHKTFVENGINARYIYSGLFTKKEREQFFKDFKDNKFQVLINIDIATEGFDYPNTGVIGLCRPTKSLSLFKQMVGRGTRLKDEVYVELYGQECIVLDFVDNTGKHDLINIDSIDHGKSALEKVFVSEEDREKLLEAEKEREERESKIDSDIDETKEIDLLKLPDKFSINISKSKRMREPATPAQISLLYKLGVWEEGRHYTKAHATEAIQKQESRASDKRFLKKMGYDISQGCTIGQYQKVYRSLENKNKFKPKELWTT